MKIPFNKPFIAGKELYYIAQAVMTEGHLSGNGSFTRKCHAWLENRLGVPRAFLTHSGTAALEMAALLCGIQPGDEVIMPSFTFVSTANAFVLRGAVPVFVDIRPDTLNIDETRIEAAVIPKTRAIVPVHYAGISCDMAPIMALAARFGLRVIEDAAHGLMSLCDGQKLGSIGDIGCLSFHETKNIISGEGGAILVNDPDLVPRAETMWEKGTDRQRYFRGETDRYTWVDIGSSFLPGELTSAFLYAQLEQADTIIARRCRIFNRYLDGLSPLESAGVIRLPRLGDNCVANGHLFYVLTESLAVRLALIDHLKKAGILSVFHYVPLHSSPAGRRYGRTEGQLPVTDTVADTLLRLPMFFDMQDFEVDAVIEAVSAFYR